MHVHIYWHLIPKISAFEQKLSCITIKPFSVKIKLSYVKLYFEIKPLIAE